MAFYIISKLIQIETSSENRPAGSVRRPITSSGPPSSSKSIRHFLLYKFAQNDVKNRMFRCSVRSVRLGIWYAGALESKKNSANVFNWGALYEFYTYTSPIRELSPKYHSPQSYFLARRVEKNFKSY